MLVLGGILMAVGGIVTATAQTHTALVAGRAILGIGMGPSECLAGALVGDLFYVVCAQACLTIAVRSPIAYQLTFTLA